MKIDKSNDFTITNYLNLTAERDVPAGLVNKGFQVPFILGLKNNPPALRRFLEAIVAAVNWETTVVDAGVTYNVTSDDVVLLADSSSTGTTVNLPVITDGRVLVLKDSSGNASNNKIQIHVSDPSSEYIESSSTTFNLNADYGAVVFVAESTASKWYTIAIM